MPEALQLEATSRSTARKAIGKAQLPVPELAAEQLREAIRLRAYELFELRAGENGSPEQDWLTAEREILDSLRSPAA